jgi:hypothetical protein
MPTRHEMCICLDSPCVSWRGWSSSTCLEWCKLCETMVDNNIIVWKGVLKFPDSQPMHYTGQNPVTCW